MCYIKYTLSACMCAVNSKSLYDVHSFTTCNVCLNTNKISGYGSTLINIVVTQYYGISDRFLRTFFGV